MSPSDYPQRLKKKLLIVQIPLHHVARGGSSLGNEEWLSRVDSGVGVVRLIYHTV